MAKDRPESIPVSKSQEKAPQAPSARGEIDAFLARARMPGASRERGHRGRLLFALDATMSRQPTWDRACLLQADMFREAESVGGLDIQLVYYRGLSECRASPWMSDAKNLARLMERIDCRGGHTQIGRVLEHARKESERAKVQAVVFVGDAMEESIDDLCADAGALGLLGVPAFMFQEGHDPIAENAFREIARLTAGAYCRFHPGSADELGALLRAVAVYAAGGVRALSDLSTHGGAAVRGLLAQLK